MRAVSWNVAFRGGPAAQRQGELLRPLGPDLPIHAHDFDPDRWQIITADGADIGVLEVEYRESEIFLSRIGSTLPIKAKASAVGLSEWSSRMPGSEGRISCSKS